jgi:hypothetical protein
MSDTGLGNKLYQGAVDFGRFKAKVGLWIAGFIAIIMFVVGVMLAMKQEDPNIVDGIATVTKVSCTSHIQQVGKSFQTEYNCTADIEYEVDGKKHVTNMNFLNRMAQLFVGSHVEISYDKNDPTKVTERQMKAKYIGWGLIGGSFLLVGLAYLSYYITMSYELVAVSQGASTAASIVSAPFRT